MNGQQTDLFDFPEQDSNVPHSFVIGVDEVGRGPLIGDVVAAAVILPDGCSLPLADSKKLSERKRIELDQMIREEAVAYAIGCASPEEIDELNILNATMLAMKRAIEQVMCQSENTWQVLVDGNRCPPIDCPCQAIVKGDGKIAEISAASILAKVYRDQQMDKLDQLYPHYGFAQHKGYPTVKHLKAIEEHGMIEGYRKSFKPIKNFLSV
ncbi:ribonuclease HII [Thiomicrorhabdus chilensis]|uniref:ribonuclease HII n=1 Tax=Thiomicrorhabdus chilensis TaxID=63656 RepID=UPI000402BD9C|nr:ribonuclease HII [Thiomicrorhabdus chilensis]